MKRPLLALGLAALMLAAQTPGAHGDHGENELLPNLKVRRVPRVELAEEMHGKRWLRFDTEVANRGRGPLHLQPKAVECDDEPQRYQTMQSLFLDHDANSVYDRAVDTAFNEHDAGCIIFHEEHNHWHFEDFARYELFKIKEGGTVRRKAVATADKVSFCMMDTAPLSTQPPGAPSSGYYKGIFDDGCKYHQQRFPPMGISVGWYDLYGMALPGQELDITGLPTGPYCLSITLDATDRLRETKELDNGRRTRIYMRGKRIDVSADKACPLPS
jgi:hypothetical protein